MGVFPDGDMISANVVIAGNPFSDFILQNFNHFGVTDAKVSHGDNRGAMIESFAQHLKAHSIVSSLDIAKGFSEGMGTIVSRQIDGPGPSLDHSVDGLDTQGLVLSGSRFEKIMLRLAILTCQECGQGFVDGLIDHEHICFAGFWFFDADGVTGLFSCEVFDFELEEVACSDAVVDAKGEQEQVSGPWGQEVLDGGDVAGVSDGLDSDLAALWGMIRFFHVWLLER